MGEEPKKYPTMRGGGQTKSLSKVNIGGCGFRTRSNERG